MEKWPRRKRDAEGRQVRTLRDFSNGILTLPKGSVVRLRRFYHGWEIDGPKCPHCGVAVHMSKVPESDLELLPEN